MVGNNCDIAVSRDWRTVETGGLCDMEAVAANGYSILTIGDDGCYATSGDGGENWSSGEIGIPNLWFYDVVAMEDGTFRVVGEKGAVLEFE